MFFENFNNELLLTVSDICGLCELCHIGSGSEFVGSELTLCWGRLAETLTWKGFEQSDCVERKWKGREGAWSFAKSEGVVLLWCRGGGGLRSYSCYLLPLPVLLGDRRFYDEGEALGMVFPMAVFTRKSCRYA